MTFLFAVLLGLVQGVAEFLPISSSGHLALLQHFFQLEEVDNLFNVLLHFATLVAVCAVYWQDIAEMVTEFFRGVSVMAGYSRDPGRRPPPARRLILLIIVGTLPLVVVLPFHDVIEGLGNYPLFISCALIVTGFLLFFADRAPRGRKSERSATLVDVLLVGLAQACATIPGLSRSGCTIAAGLALGFRRKFAVRYSFLLSLPAVLGATLLKVIKVLGSEALPLDRLPMYLVGMVVAGVVGYFSIQLVKLLTSRGGFGMFAWYCWAVGLISLVAQFLIK